MWTDLRGEANDALVRSRALAQMEEVAPGASQPGAMADGSLLEYWEWQERQSKFVVNGQRSYDYYGLDWAMPLWEREYMDFWKAVPLAHKMRQGLYVKYLEQGHAHAGVFRDIETKVWRWPGLTILAVPLARAAGLLLGGGAKDSVYAWLKYFGHSHHNFAALGYGNYLRRCRTARSAQSFFMNIMLHENFGKRSGVEAPL